MSISRIHGAVNCGHPPRPADDPPDCPECHDVRVWCLDPTATGYVPVCPSCAADELPPEPPDDVPVDPDGGPEPPPERGESGCG